MLYSMQEIAVAALAKRRSGQLYWKGILFCVLGFLVAEFVISYLFVSRDPVTQKVAVAMILAWLAAKVLFEVEREIVSKSRLK